MTSRTSARHIRLSFVGDVCLAGGLQKALAKHGPDYPFESIRSAFLGSDLVIGNLECCVIGGSIPPETPDNIMLVDADLAQGLLRSGINVMSLANNHILDGGESGLLSTQRFLEDNGIRYFGAGRNLRAAEEPLLLICNNLRLALLGASDVPTVYATASSAGVAPMVADDLRRRITAVRDEADCVIVAIHADLEFVAYPSPSRVRLSRWLVEHGADLVIQHHPHVCQGVEKHGNGLIAYSLGNFVFHAHGNRYFERHRDTRWGMILHVDVSISDATTTITHEVSPITIAEGNATAPSNAAIGHEQISFIQHISDQLANTKLLRQQWRQRCFLEGKSTLLGLYYLARKQGLRAAATTGYNVLRSPYERRWIYGLLTWGLWD